MRKRIAFLSKTVYMVMAGAVLLLGLQGCMKKDYVRCEVTDKAGIIIHSTVGELATEFEQLPDVPDGAPGACYTMQVTSPYSAAGYKKVNNLNQIVGTAPAGSVCSQSTSKCSSEGASGCGRTSPNKCRHAWYFEAPPPPGDQAGSHPCGCICAP